MRLTSPNYQDDHAVSRVDYHNPDRLADVMALIQVLALGLGTRRTEMGLQRDLQRKPLCASNWTEFAKQHPEFFRVRDEADDSNPEYDYRVSLIARAVMPRGVEEHRDPLSGDLVSKLLDIAISLHDRARVRREQWKSWLPVAVAIIVGLATIAAALLKRS